MRLFKNLIILLGSILFLFGNVYALNLHCLVDKYSLSNCSHSFDKNKFYGFTNPAIKSMIKSSPSLIKFNDSHEPNELIENFNRDLINIHILYGQPGLIKTVLSTLEMIYTGGTVN